MRACRDRRKYLELTHLKVWLTHAADKWHRMCCGEKNYGSASGSVHFSDPRSSYFVNIYEEERGGANCHASVVCKPWCLEENQYRACTVVAHFLVGGLNSLCGQSRERWGNLRSYDVIKPAFSKPSVSALIFSKAEKNPQGLVYTYLNSSIH